MRSLRQSALTEQPARVPTDASPDEKRRFTRHHVRVFFADLVLDYVGFNMLSPVMVLQEFLTHLTPLNFVVGLPAALYGLITGLSQPMAARIVERVRDTKRYCMVMRVAARAMFLILGLIVPFLAVPHPGIMVVVTLFFIAVFWVFTGFNLPAYSVLFSKVIPQRSRGRLLGTGGAIGSICAALAGIGVAAVLRSDQPWGGFPNGYALCIVTGAVILLMQVFTTAAIREPAGPEMPDQVSLGKYLYELWTFARTEVQFRRYILAAWCGALGQMGTIFYMSYAIRELGAGTGQSGVFTAVVTGTGAGAGILWAHVSTRRSNLAVVRSGVGIMIFGALWASLAPNLWAFYPAIVLTTLGSWGLEMGGYNLQLDFGGQRTVARCVAVAQTALFLPRFVGPLLAGVVADVIGFRVLFAGSCVCFMVAFVLTTRIKDPTATDAGPRTLPIPGPTPA